MRDYPINKIKLNGKTRWQLDTRELINGVKFGKRRVFKTQQAAIEAKQQYKVQVPVVAEEIKNYPKVRDAMVEFANSSYYVRSKKHLKGYKNTPETVRDRINRYNRYLDSFFKDDSVETLNTSRMHELSDYIQDLSNDNGDPISQNLMYHLFSDILAMIHYLAEEDIINEVHVKDKDKIGKPNSKKPKCWSINEFMMFIDVVDNPTEKKFFRACAFLGWRKSEGFGLKFKSVDFVNNKVVIESQLKGPKKGDSRLKTSDSYRTIDCPEVVMNDFKDLYKEKEEAGLTEKEIMNSYVYTDNKNEPFAPETIRQHFNKCVDKSGVTKLHLHDLRHFYATTMLKNDIDIKYVQNQLGHSNKNDTIIKYYLSMITDEKEKKKNPFDKLEKMH